jgi:hypothetical protein
MTPEYKKPPQISKLANFIFMTRWLQLPLYIGLILAQIVYVYHFWIELVDLCTRNQDTGGANRDSYRFPVIRPGNYLCRSHHGSDFACRSGQTLSLVLTCHSFPSIHFPEFIST